MQRMSEYKKQACFEGDHDHDHHAWSFVKKLEQDQETIEEETSTISNGSSSISSCCSFDTTDDASSSSSNSARSSVLDLSDLMAQLPIKRGLSKFYNGKSESFTNLSGVMSIEDLPKKLKMRKMNSKSYGGGLDSFKSHTLPRSNISKKHSPFLRQRSFAKSTFPPCQQHNNN